MGPVGQYCLALVGPKRYLIQDIFLYVGIGDAFRTVDRHRRVNNVLETLHGFDIGLQAGTEHRRDPVGR